MRLLKAQTVRHAEERVRAGARREMPNAAPVVAATTKGNAAFQGPHSAPSASGQPSVMHLAGPSLLAELDLLKNELIAARSALAESDAKMSARVAGEARASYAKGRNEGYEEGHKDGHKAGLRDGATAAIRDDAARTRSLVEALQAFRETLDERMQETSAFAVSVALGAIEKIAGDATNRRDLVAGAVNASLADIEASTVLALTVSARDFADEGALRIAVGAALPLDRIACHIDANASAGHCVLKLRLGSIDLSLPAQIGKLRQALGDLLEEET